MSQPLVSVVIPAYNAAATIERALRSVAAQTHRPLEVLVVDDASTDATATLAAGFADIEVRLARLTANGGPSRARNAGIDLASGAYLAFLDSDDEWLPEKTARQVAMLQANPAMSIVGCRTAPIGEWGQSPTPVPAHTPVTGRDGWKGLMYESWLHTGCVMTRTALARREKFDTTLLVAEDRDLWIRLARHGELGFVPHCLARRHGATTGFMQRHKTRMHTDLVPLIARHVRAFRAELSAKDIRRVLGNTYTVTGRYLYNTRADTALGAAYLVKAVLRRQRVAGNLWQLAINAPGARWLRTRLAGARRRPAPSGPPGHTPAGGDRP